MAICISICRVQSIANNILGKETTPYIELFYHVPDERHLTIHIRFNEDVTVEREWNEHDEQELLHDVTIVQSEREDEPETMTTHHVSERENSPST